MMKSHFFAYINKIRWIQRWGLKRNSTSENVMEHSWEVATISHSLAVIKNTYFGSNLDVEKITVAALYHDCSEVITGDMPSPIKYHSNEITEAYKSIERRAERELLALLPQEMKPHFNEVLIEENITSEHMEIIKAADTISAFLKCQTEVKAGNNEFSVAARDIKAKLVRMSRPEIDYFLEIFVPSFDLTLDELMNK